MRGILRRFNDAGIAEFVRRIEIMRAGGTAEIDDAFVTDAKWTAPVVPEMPMERPPFQTKRNAGEYLSPRTRAARDTYGDDGRGLWTWLSAWHWDAVCPVREDAKRQVLGPYHYVYGHGSRQRIGQHLLALSVTMYELAPHTHFTLNTPLLRVTQAVKEVSTRLSLLRLRGLIDLLDILYWDQQTQRPKPGLVDTRGVRPGDLAHRLPARIRQLEVTHDLTNLTAEQLLSLLGDEFRQWAVAPSPPAAAPRRRAK